MTLLVWGIFEVEEALDIRKGRLLRTRGDILIGSMGPSARTPMQSASLKRQPCPRTMRERKLENKAGTGNQYEQLKPAKSQHSI